MKYMEVKNWTTLPDPKFMREEILLRDNSKYVVEDGDSDAVREEKRKGMARFNDLMDLFTEVLLPACAGKKLFHPKIRHFETATESKLPGPVEQARITCGTEAFTVLTYMNNHKKWNAHRKWQTDHPNGEKCPRYTSKYPDQYLNFRAKYSDSEVGTNKWGGWTPESKKLYVALQKESFKSRQDNLERNIQVDQECVDRLREQFAHMHRNENRGKKQRVAAPPIDEDDEDFNPVFEV